MRQRLWLVLVSAAMACSATAAERPASIFEMPGPAAPVNEIDRLVFAKLAEKGIEPVLCSDAVFVRRLYVDVLGTLPTAEEAREFIRDPSPTKRQALIDRLLARDEFAAYWTMKWGDVLRIKAEFPVNLWPNAAQAYHRWVRASIAQNKPYDRFARELLTSSGSNFRVGPVNFYRAIQNRTPEGIASATALALMGARTDAWPKERLAGMAAFFSQVGYKSTREWKEENVFWDPLKTAVVAKNEAAAPPEAKKPEAPAAPPPPPQTPGPLAAVFPDGAEVVVPPDRDPREAFADWLISPKNPWFTKAIANRVWWWLMGRGIVHEPDDLRDDNPPCHPALLAYLEKELIASKYDLKALYRLILNSATYQASSLPLPKDRAPAPFARYPVRRLDAEVLIDAVNKITGDADLYTSPIPEPFTYIPQGQPAVALADGSITSPFLALFGRSARATGMENERDNKPVPAQSLHMLNSSHIQRKLEQGAKLKELLDPSRKQDEIAVDLYLTILARFPTEEELKIVDEHGKTFAQPKAAPAKAGKGKAAKGAKPAPPPKPYALPKRRDQWIDIAWALINSPEFLYRH